MTPACLYQSTLGGSQPSAGRKAQSADGMNSLLPGFQVPSRCGAGRPPLPGPESRSGFSPWDSFVAYTQPARPVDLKQVAGRNWEESRGVLTPLQVSSRKLELKEGTIPSLHH